VASSKPLPISDAAGSKLSKVITDSLAKHSTTILYVAGFVYQQIDTITSPGGGTDTLQFIGHEEGRARWAYHKYTTGATAYKFEYDFFERDHLGNTRTVLTQERDTSNYIATMEAAYRSTEEQLFGNIPTTCVAWTSMPNYAANIPSGVRYLYGSTNDSVSKVDSSSAGGQKTGPNLLLKVMSGDSVSLCVQCYYVTPGGGSTNYSSFSDVLTSLGQGLVNLTGGAHGTLGALETPGSNVYTGLTSFLNSDDTAHSGYPKAYINWIFLDDQFKYDSTLSGSVLAASSTYAANQMNLVAPGGPLALHKNGYLYIWVSNETSGWDVFFDNLSVQYKQGPLLEENHYYPYGLTMAGISDKAIKTQYAENKYRYNGGTELQSKEFSDGSGLELYETSFRSFDPQLGRFFQIDPLADQFSSLTTYQYAGDNPVLSNDPTGSTVQAIPHGQGESPGSNTQAVEDSYAEEDAGGDPFGGGGGGGGGGGSGGTGGSGSGGDLNAFLDNVIGTLWDDGGGAWTNDGSGNGTGVYSLNDAPKTVGGITDFPVYSPDGEIIGDVIVNNYDEYHDLDGFHGIDINLSFQSAVGNIGKLNWVQNYVEDTEPPGSCLLPNTQYNDPQPPDDDLPYYYTMHQLPFFTSPLGTGISFEDNNCAKFNIASSFTLSLVVMGANGQPSSNLITFQYGYTNTNGQVYVKPLSPYW
jgi:RHS repeat-associated protein